MSMRYAALVFLTCAITTSGDVHAATQLPLPQTMDEALKLIESLSKENEELKNRIARQSASEPEDVPPPAAAPAKGDLQPVEDERAAGDVPRPLSPSTPSAYVIAPRVDTFLKSGPNRTIAGTDAFVPLSWNGKGLGFMDVRFVGDDQENREGNFGLGYRWIPESQERDIIVGAYGFFDRRRTETGNMFSQATIGAELLTEQWDGRINGYVALSGEKMAGMSVTQRTNLALSGNNIVAQSTETENYSIETPMSGLDLELGWHVPFEKDPLLGDTAVYGGAYHFDAPGVDAMSGYRARIRTRPFDWLELGIEYQDDNLRGSDHFAEVRFRIPLGKTPERRKPTGIYARLDDRIVRDIDIVTQARSRRLVTAETNATVTNTATGNAQKVYVVDNTAAGGGNGSTETPYNTLASAMGVAGAHDIVYVRSGDGTTTGQDQLVTMDDQGQMLVGAGSALTFDDLSMDASGLILAPVSGQVIVPAGTAPVLTNSILGQNGIDITAANVTVKGVTLRNITNNGITIAHTADNTTIRDVTVRDSTFNGLHTNYTTAGQQLTGLRIENSSFIGNGDNAVQLYASGGASIVSPVLSRLTVEDSGSFGILFYSAGGGSTISNLSLTDTTITGSASQGVRLVGTLSAPVLSGLRVDNSGDTGIIFYSTGAGSTLSGASLTDSTITNSGNYGIRILAEATGIISAPVFSGLRVDDSGEAGIFIHSTGAGSSLSGASVTGSTVTGSGGYGLLVQAIANGSISNPTLSGLNVEDSSVTGILLHSTGAGSTLSGASITDSMITDSDDYGVQFRADGGGSLTGSTLSRSTIDDTDLSGVYLLASGAGSILSGASVTNSTITNSDDYGVYAQAAGGAAISNPVLSGLTVDDGHLGGIYLYSTGAGSTLSGASVTNSTVTDSSNYGVRLFAESLGMLSTPTLSGLNVDDSGVHGILISSTGAGSSLSGASMSNIRVTNSADYGVYVSSDASGALNLKVQSVSATGNLQYGFYINDDTTGAFQVDMGGGALGSTGQNRIFGNQLQDIRSDMDGGVLSARSNWWGSATGLSAGERVLESGTIDSSNFLVADPNP